MIDLETLLRFALALVLVLVLIAGLSWAGRKYLVGRGFGARGGAARRLGILEATAIDSRARLVLVRRDDAEHLLVVTASGATVIETGIGRAGAGPAPPAGAPR